MPVLTVAIVIHQGVQALDVAGPVDVFIEVNNYVAAGDGYETVLVAADRSPVRAANGMRLLADLTFEEAIGGFDIILVAGGPALPTAEPDLGLVQWVQAAPWRASVYGSICTGAFVLGHAGLLDDRRWAQVQTTRSIDALERLWTDPPGYFGRSSYQRHVRIAFANYGVSLGLQAAGRWGERAERLNAYFEAYRSGDEYDTEAITHVMACTSHFPGAFLSQPENRQVGRR